MARRIEIDLEGVVVTARLLDDKAPKACQAIWDMLPHEDMWTHGHWSGHMFHTNNHPKLNIEGRPENQAIFYEPGTVVLYPGLNELCIAYDMAQWRFLGRTGNVSIVAKIEGDFTEFAKKAERLQWEGAKKVIFRRKEG